MASSYSSIVGNPPHPKTFAFRDWYYRLLALRVAYCAKPRTTNYYFAQAGNDSTGDGSQGNPYKTLAKAQTLVAANTGLFFKRGDTWTETAGLTDNGSANVTFGAWGTAGAKPTISGASSSGSVNGITISGDGSWVDGLYVTDWGTSGGQDYPIQAQCTGTNAVLISNCEADTTYTHVIGHYASSGGSGGIVTVVGCIAGGVTYASGNPFNFYTDNGGHEYIVESCTVKNGPSGTYGGGTGVYSHTLGTPIALGIVNRLHCLGGSNAIAFSVGFGNLPSASTPADARGFEIDTYQELASGNGVDPGLTNGVRINGRYYVQPANASTRCMGSSAQNCWSYNSIFIIDGTNVDTTDYFAWWNYNNSGASSFAWEHAAALYQNWATRVGLEYTAVKAALTTNTTESNDGVTLSNCIFSATPAPPGAPVCMGLEGPGADGNAYYIYPTDGANQMMSSDAHAIQLVNQPQVGIRGDSPMAGVSQLYQSAQPPADGVVLEYDADWQPRNPAGQNVGPIEVVARRVMPSLWYIGE